MVKSEKTKKNVTLPLDIGLATRLKMQAARERRNQTDILRELIDRYLAERNA